MGMSFEPTSMAYSQYGFQYISNLPRHGVLIRYANVLYPLDFTDVQDEELKQQIKNIRSYFDSGNIIIQAEPDSLSLAPSREGISMSDYSVESLKKLLSELNSKTKKQYHEAGIKFVKEAKDLLKDKDAFECLSFVRANTRRRMIACAVVDNRPPSMDSSYVALSKVWATRNASSKLARLVRNTFYDKFAQEYNVSAQDMKTLKAKCVKPKEFYRIFRPILNKLLPLKLPQLKVYCLRGDTLKSINTAYYGNIAQVTNILTRKVYIGRTVQDFKDTRLSQGLFIRYGDASTQKKVIEVLEAVNADYVDISPEIEKLAPTRPKRHIPKVADYEAGVPLLDDKAILSTDIKTIVVRSKSGSYSTAEGMHIDSYALTLINRYDSTAIGVVPSVTIARALAKRWNLVTPKEFGTKMMQEMWDKHKSEWLVDTHTLGQVVNSLKEIMNAEPHGLGVRGRRWRSNYLEFLLSEKHAEFKFSYPSMTDKACKFLDSWSDLNYNLGLQTAPIRELKELLHKNIPEKELPVGLVRYAKALAQWKGYAAFDDDDYQGFPEVVKFINQQVRKVENEYKNKGGSSSRNYGYYYPVQARR